MCGPMFFHNPIDQGLGLQHVPSSASVDSEEACLDSEELAVATEEPQLSMLFNWHWSVCVVFSEIPQVVAGTNSLE